VAEEQKERQIVSRERVRAHGEVYTAEREVNAMLDLVKAQSEDDGSTFLEPACGDGNFLVAILRRKLAALRKKYRRSPFDFEFNSLLVLGLLYGVDILPDNVTRCRRRLFDEWTAAYRAVRKKPPDEDLAKSAAFILDDRRPEHPAHGLHDERDAGEVGRRGPSGGRPGRAEAGGRRAPRGGGAGEVSEANPEVETERLQEDLGRC